VSKTRVPRLPAGSNRATIQAYVKDVQRYAQAEFKRGATEQEVYDAVNREGISLPALKSAIGREYTLFLGVSDSSIKGLRFFSMLIAMFFYGVLSSHIITESPLYRYAMPAFLAVALFLGFENIGLKTMRALKKRKNS